MKGDLRAVETLFKHIGSLGLNVRPDPLPYQKIERAIVYPKRKAEPAAAEGGTLIYF